MRICCQVQDENKVSTETIISYQLLKTVYGCFERQVIAAQKLQKVICFNSKHHVHLQELKLYECT